MRVVSPLFCAFAIGAVALGGCPGPQYPKCENDNQCKTDKSGKAIEEHCLYGACQQCAADSHCPPDEKCNAGRCEAKPTASKATAPAPTTAATASAPIAACPEHQTVHFDFNTAELRPDARAVLDELGRCFEKDKAKSWALTIEGHCDERGTTEYNLSLGERRAEVIVEYLTRLGANRARIKTISYGKERPIDRSGTEAAWAKNRRGELTFTTSGS